MRIIPVLNQFIVDGAINYPGYDPISAEKNLTAGEGGPFELVASILIIAMFVFIVGSFLVKKDKLRLFFGFAAGIDAIAAMIVYPINQMTYGGPIIAALMGVLLIGLIYSVIFIITRIRDMRKMEALRKQAEAAAASAPDRRPGRRFDD